MYKKQNKKEEDFPSPSFHLFLYIELECLHAAWSTLLGTWQVLEGRDGNFLAHIHDAEMWEVGTLLGLPVSALLQVKHLVEC